MPHGIRSVKLKHSIHGQTQVRVQHRVERDKHHSANVQYAMQPVVINVLQKGFPLSIVLDPYHGRDGITQDGPWLRCQWIVHFKGATFISVAVDDIKYSLTKPFSRLLSIHKRKVNRTMSSGTRALLHLIRQQRKATESAVPITTPLNEQKSKPETTCYIKHGKRSVVHGHPTNSPSIPCCHHTRHCHHTVYIQGLSLKQFGEQLHLIVIIKPI